MRIHCYNKDHKPNRFVIVERELLRAWTEYLQLWKLTSRHKYKMCNILDKELENKIKPETNYWAMRSCWRTLFLLIDIYNRNMENKIKFKVYRK